MQLPGKNILVLAAVCLSVLGGVGAYKVAQASRDKLNGASYSGIVTSANAQEIGNNSNSTNKLLSALEEIELASATGKTSANPFDPADDDTLTARLSKNFFSSYIQAQAADGQSAADDEALVNNALGTVDLSTIPREIYTTSDMNIVAGNTKEELRSYGNIFATIQANKLIDIQRNPSKYNNDLNAIGTIYTSIAAELLTMKVPVAIAAEHLAIANAYYLSSEDFKLISDQINDPMKSLIGLRQYKDALERQQQMYTEIAKYLKSNGILFSDTEPGYFWTELGNQ